jgi:Rod binding domain-containing protein
MLMDIMNIPYTPYLPERQLPRMKAAASVRQNRPVDKNSKLYKVSVEFEAIFIKQMLNVMRKSVAKTKLLHGGMAEDFFEDMLYDEYAKKMAENGDFGIADMIYQQLDITA